MAYHIVNNTRTPVKFGGVTNTRTPNTGGRTIVKENYVPAQNTDMIYIGIFIGVLVLLILVYILYKNTKQ